MGMRDGLESLNKTWDRQFDAAVNEALTERCERNEKITISDWISRKTGASFTLRCGPWILGVWSLTGNGYIDAPEFTFGEPTCDRITARNIYQAIVEAAPEGTVLLPQEEATVWFTRKGLRDD